MLGFRIGYVNFPTWQVAVETAQVGAGFVHYPAGNPFYICDTKLWTILAGFTGSERRSNLLGGQHAREHGIVTPLDARHVHEPGGAADQRATGKRQLWYRLPSAFGNGARAIGN